MTYYKVIQHYYDTGKVTASIATIDADDLPEAEFKSTAHADIYVDYFSDKRKADACRNAALNA